MSEERKRGIPANAGLWTNSKCEAKPDRACVQRCLSLLSLSLSPTYSRTSTSQIAEGILFTVPSAMVKSNACCDCSRECFAGLLCEISQKCKGEVCLCLRGLWQFEHQTKGKWLPILLATFFFPGTPPVGWFSGKPTKNRVRGSPIPLPEGIDPKKEPNFLVTPKNGNPN